MPHIWAVGTYLHDLLSHFDMILGVLDFLYFYGRKII